MDASTWIDGIPEKTASGVNEGVCRGMSLLGKSSVARRLREGGDCGDCEDGGVRCCGAIWVGWQAGTMRPAGEDVISERDEEEDSEGQGEGDEDVKEWACGGR